MQYEQSHKASGRLIGGGRSLSYPEHIEEQILMPSMLNCMQFSSLSKNWCYSTKQF